MIGKLRAALDRNRRGTHYTDRMHRILAVCLECGLLWHEERIRYGNGIVEKRRIDDIEPVPKVKVTPQYEKYGLRVNPRILPKLKRMGPQFAYALNVASASVEVDGNIVYIRVPVDDAEDVSVTFQQAWRIEPDIPVGSLLLGIDDDFRQLVLQLTAPTSVHAAVIGMTGSGKSTLMRTMILSAQLIGGADIAIFDPSRGFWGLSGHPSVWRGGLFQTPEECELGLAALARSIGGNPPDHRCAASAGGSGRDHDDAQYPCAHRRAGRRSLRGLPCQRAKRHRCGDTTWPWRLCYRERQLHAPLSSCLRT